MQLQDNTNYHQVLTRLQNICARLGLGPEAVKLCAVSKTYSVSEIDAVYSEGCHTFGESYVQEALPKIALLPADVSWHFIGHLQSNKVKSIAGKFDLIHCIDSLNILKEIDKRSSEVGVVQRILIEVKLDPSPTKHGAEPGELPYLKQLANELTNVELCGLMGMPPYDPNPEMSRTHFKVMKELFDGLQVDNRKILSMGMSNDFEIAVEEGSNLVRVGTAIFGTRNTKV